MKIMYKSFIQKPLSLGILWYNKSMNGNEMGRTVQNAREMTKEIDQVTEAEVEKLAQQAQYGMDRGQAGSLGSQILTHNSEDDDPVHQENEVISSNNEVRRMAEAEEGYVEAAKFDTSIVGAETSVQAKERLAEDREDISNETGMNGLYVKNIMSRNNKRITDETVAAVDHIIASKSYHPGELDEIANKARVKFLKDVFNRILGSRN